MTSPLQLPAAVATEPRTKACYTVIVKLSWSEGASAGDLNVRNQMKSCWFLLLVLVCGCRGDNAKAERYACDCSFLTDMDGASGVPVEVCAAGPDKAEQVAQGCAQSGAPAPIEACACRPQRAASGCKAGECKVLEQR